MTPAEQRVVKAAMEYWQHCYRKQTWIMRGLNLSRQRLRLFRACLTLSRKG